MEPSPVHHRVNPGKTLKQGGRVVPVNGECRGDSNFRFTQLSRNHLFADFAAVYVRVIASLEQNGQSDGHAGTSDTTVQPIGGRFLSSCFWSSIRRLFPKYETNYVGTPALWLRNGTNFFLTGAFVVTRCHCGP
ncbi:hypothetical protein MRX96_046925 [Rhipicephalus microplus]